MSARWHIVESAEHVRPHRLQPVFLLLCPAVGCYNDPVDNLAVWSEFLPLAEVRIHLPALSRFDAELYLAIRPDDLNDELASFFRDAQAAGVAVRPWLQLPDAGVWVSESNAPAFAGFVFDFLDWAAAHDVPVHRIIFDIEPPLAFAEQLRTAAAEGGINAALMLLAGHLDPDAFEAARQTLHDLVDALHALDIQVMAATLPWTIDDLDDADADLQDLFDTPLAGIPWDGISVILYRPALAELFGLPLSPGYVARYAESMVRHFGDRAQVAVGNISLPGLLLPPGYSDPHDVFLDVSAARSAGINAVSLYSLDGMLLAGGPERWLDAAAAPTLNFAFPDPPANLVRAFFALLDKNPKDES